MKPERVIRFIVPTRELLERMATVPLPGGLREQSTELDFFRDVYYDTPGSDLRPKAATVRVRIRRDGSRTLLVDVRERETEDAAVVRRYSEADVPEEDAQAMSTTQLELMLGLNVLLLRVRWWRDLAEIPGAGLESRA